MEKSVDAFRTISEVADDLDLPQHVLRFWETRFAQIRPLKRAGGRRYYRPADVVLLRSIRQLLYDEGYTIKGVQRLLKEKGPRGLREEAAHGGDPAADFDDADTAYDETGGAEGPDGFGHPSAAAPLQSANDREAVASAGSDEIGRGAVFSAVTDSSLPGFDPRAFDAGSYGRVGLDRTALAEILVTIEECHRILIAVRRPRS